MTTLLFDGFPGNKSANIYRGIRLMAAAAIWFTAEKKEKQAAP